MDARTSLKDGANVKPLHFRLLSLVAEPYRAENSKLRRALLPATRLFREFHPHANHMKKVRPEAGRRSIYGQASTLCRQAHARQRVFFNVVWLGHGAPPVGAGALASLCRRRANRRCR
jgi:hypothetical protein